MDLTKLSDVLRNGKIVEERGRSIGLYSPIFRGSFMKLKRPGQLLQVNGKWTWEEKPARWDLEKSPYYQLNALFNVGNKDAPGHVNLWAVYLPALAKLSTATGIEVDGLFDEDGKLSKKIRKLGMGNITYLETTATAKNKNESGEWYPGTGPGIFSAQYKSHCKHEDFTGPLLLSGRKGPDGKKIVLSPEEMIDGYWYRAYVQFFANKFGTISQSFTTLQFVAKDEPFGGARRPKEEDIDDVDDADDINERVEEEGIDDDVDLDDIG